MLSFYLWTYTKMIKFQIKNVHFEKINKVFINILLINKIHHLFLNKSVSIYKLHTATFNSTPLLQITIRHSNLELIV